MALGHEVDQHGVEVGEPATGQTGAVEQGVDSAADGVHGCSHGVGVLQVHGW